MTDARSRDLEFNLTVEYLWQLFEEQAGKCALSGLPISFGATTKDRDATASLDRKDSTLGYVTGNVWWVHKEINFMKGTLPLSRFIDYCTKISLLSHLP
jgi:hypothetical protein